MTNLTHDLNSDLLTYSVWRLDDNNNHFKICDELSFEKAQEIALIYEKKGHKQLYYVKLNEQS